MTMTIQTEEQVKAFSAALIGVPIVREDLAEHLGITSRALRHYAAGTRPIPRLVALEVVKLSEPDQCVCAAIPDRQRGERCNHCRRARVDK